MLASTGRPRPGLVGDGPGALNPPVTQDRSRERKRAYAKRRTTDAESEWFQTRASRVPLCCLVGAIVACGASRPAESDHTRFWTVSQAESIKLVRGTPLKTTACKGLGQRHASVYRRFSCVGVHWPKDLAYPLPVRVRYVLNPRGKYRGKLSPYLATSVYFDSFGVP
jgi:hypothetical protein